MQLRAEVVIEAPPERVWAVLIDFARYREWNPFITIEGRPEVGRPLKVEFSPPDSKSVTYKPTLVALEDNRELRFKGHFFVKGLLDGEHFFRLAATDEGHTRLTQGQDFDGMLLKVMGKAMTQMARGQIYMNQALRRRVLGG